MNTTDFLTRDESAMYYICGYSADNALLLSFGNEYIFITDSRYSTEARELSKTNINLEIIESSNLAQEAIAQIKKNNIKKLQFDPMRMNVEEYFLFKDIVELESAPNFTQNMRIIKTKEEIQLLLDSQRLNLKAFHTFAQYISQEGKGKSEKYLWYKIADILSDYGQYPLSFEPIVGINANAAKPHALPSNTTLLDDDCTLLLDCGLKYQHYCSDCTRTAIFTHNHLEFDKNQNFTSLDSIDSNAQAISPKEKQKIYDIVKKAQMNVIEKVRSGMNAKEVDSLARDVIHESGYGKYFLHSTGHGIGLDIHEMPFISQRSHTTIEDGMVFSVEPGIYLNGTFGVRIEDLVVMKNGRAEILA